MGASLLGLVVWTALGTGASTQRSIDDFSSPVVAEVSESPDPSAKNPSTQEPTTLASHSPRAADSHSADTRSNDRPADDSSSSNHRPGLFGPGGPLQFSPDEIARAKPAADAFWEKYSPERAKELRGLPPRRKNNWEEAATVAYLKLEQMREKSPDLYDIAVKRVQAEDIVFHLVSDLKKTNGDAKSSQPLHEAVETVVKLNLQERQLRLDRLAKTLKDQQDALKSDEDPVNLEKQVNERLLTVMNERAAPFSGRSGGAGGHGGRGNGQSISNTQ